MYCSTCFIVVFLLVGCTADNPNFRPSILFDAGVGDPHDLHVSGAGHDLDRAGDEDLRGVGSKPDLAKPLPDLTVPQCVAGTRFCNDNKIVVCDHNKYVVERYCPQGSACSNASCVAPTPNQLPALSGSSCEGEQGPNENFCLDNLALNLSCQPFVTGNGGGNGGILWECATQVGGGTPTTPCSNGATCRSGFCGSNGTCFRACNNGSDCPSPINGVNVVCDSVEIVVEGHKISENSCIPAN